MIGSIELCSPLYICAKHCQASDRSFTESKSAWCSARVRYGRCECTTSRAPTLRQRQGCTTAICERQSTILLTRMGFLNILKGYVSPTRIGQPALRKPKKPPPPPRNYVRELGLYFVAWKLLLLGIAYASPGPGYDTSTAILFNQGDVQAYTALDKLLLKLTRWDALYFASSSLRGHVYEQEWAFSWALSRLTAVISKGRCLDSRSNNPRLSIRRSIS